MSKKSSFAEAADIADGCFCECMWGMAELLQIHNYSNSLISEKQQPDMVEAKSDSPVSQPLYNW